MIDPSDLNEKNYYQFPIGALRFDTPLDEVSPDDARQRMQLISAWCVGRVASQLYIGDEFWRIADDAARDHPDCDHKDERIGRLLVASRMLHITLGSLDDPDYYESAQLNDYTRPDARVRTDIFLDFRDSMTWREFAILSAIYAAIGRDQLRKVSFSWINALSLGYSRPSDAIKPLFLTRYQMRATVAKLQLRSLFTRASANSRDYFYSNSCDQTQLEQAVIAIEAKKLVRKVERKQRESTARIKAGVLKQLEAIQQSQVPESVTPP